ncbi:glycosyltransferase family 1 protein [Neobacillus vireti]|uniref:Group 1 glycosyl transferase n=1 Tax=Neobacillus vireti LMG 21834 TaxID=1131730 RepID=A0AB94IKI0_9BACI|nr:glycosyltransferase family 1 protein [Neobacillus vireti]ETI67566.1 group 1 glycosyl transferase [Neobacillus vireti LMG 21834]KLT18484.1 glycosyl transferase family 1 [Neobacillus vireti]
MGVTNAPKRILQIVSAMNRGGTETLLMNLYRNIDKSKVQFDFVSHRKEKCHYDDEIELMGGKVFRISSLGQSGPILYIRELEKIMSSNDYIAVHSHTDYQSGFPALAAKLTGINKRICHSHSNQWTRKSSFKENLKLKLLQKIIKFSATEYCACSKEAAEFLFGDQQFEQGKVHILKNGIDVDKFTCLTEDSDFSVRKELSIPSSAKIIGHVGSLSHIKNQEFILRIMKQLIDEGLSVYAIFVGDGELKTYLKDCVQQLDLEDFVRFIGVRSDISRLMKAFDVFVFPSLYEGFGIVALEAQCAGTPCVVSDTVPKTTDMGLGLISYISLDEDLNHWSEEIKKSFLLGRPDSIRIHDNFLKNGFHIKENVHHWLSLYGI